MNDEAVLRETGHWFDGDLTQTALDPDLTGMVDEETALLFQVIPIGMEHGEKTETLVLATHLVENFVRITPLQSRLNRTVRLVFTSEDNIKQGLIVRYKNTLGISNDGGLFPASPEDGAEEEEDNSDIQNGASSPFVEKVNHIIRGAVQDGASDIHILPLDTGSQVFFRLEGDLEDVSRLYPVAGRREKLKIVNRFKNQCDPPLNIGKRNIEQKGGFRMKSNDNKWINFRVSVIPTVRGEKVVVRLLDPFGELRNIEALGFFPEDVKRLKVEFQRDHGLLIWAGPTGMGKTTSIYAAVENCCQMNPKINVCTIEDPPEYNVPKYTQVLVSEAEEFAQMLRATLRQDPDIIIVGEIRNDEIARIALQASQTGHKVFTTIHANNCLGTMDRLSSMGINMRELLAQLTCIASQRLFKVNCPECSKIQMEISEETAARLTGEELESIKAGTPKKGTGCPKCNQKGYLGRMAVGEFLFFDNEVRDFFRGDPSLVEMERFLRDDLKFHSMWDKGLQLVREGKIALENMLRVLDRQ